MIEAPHRFLELCHRLESLDKDHWMAGLDGSVADLSLGLPGSRAVVLEGCAQIACRAAAAVAPLDVARERYVPCRYEVPVTLRPGRAANRLFCRLIARNGQSLSFLCEAASDWEAVFRLSIMVLPIRLRGTA